MNELNEMGQFIWMSIENSPHYSQQIKTTDYEFPKYQLKRMINDAKSLIEH